MAVASAHRVIDAPAETVFGWFADSGNLRRVPGILSVRIQDGPDGAVGTVRTITTPVLRVTEEITTADAPELIRYRITSSIPPIRHEDGTIQFRPTSEGTEVTWSSTFEAAVPFASIFGTALTAFLKKVLTTAFDSTLRAADRELTGEKRARA